MVKTGKQQWLVCLLFSSRWFCTVHFHIITAHKKHPGCARLSVSARLWGLRFSGLHLSPERTVVVPHARSTLFLVCGTWRHCSNSCVTLSNISHLSVGSPSPVTGTPPPLTLNVGLSSHFLLASSLKNLLSSPDLVVMCGPRWRGGHVWSRFSAFWILSS